MESQTKVSILAKSSSGNHSYQVDFHLHNDKLLVFCDCPAGNLGKFCKHKWELLSGNKSMLFDVSEDEKLNKVLTWVEKSDFKNLYSKVDELENQLELIKKEIKKEKKNVEKKFREGF